MNVIATILVTAAVCAAIGFVSTRLALKANQRIAARRIHAAELACKYEAYGLQRIPELLRIYSTGDYVELARKLRSVAEVIKTSESSLIAEFDTVYNRILEKKLQDKDAIHALAARVREAEALLVKETTA